MKNQSFNTLLRFSVRQILFNGLILSALVAMLVTVYLVMLHSANEHQHMIDRYHELIAQGEPSITANISHSVVVRPRPLQVFANGASFALNKPVSVMRQLEAALNIKYSVSLDEKQKNLVTTLIDGVDPHLVLKYLLPLFAILIGYRFICGERERGTLLLVMSNPVLRRDVLLSKIIAGVFTLMLATTLIIMTVLVVYWQTGIYVSTADYGNLMIIFGALFLYGLVYLALSMFVSVIVRSSGLSIMISLFIWCFFVIVAPALAVGVAGIIEPSPQPQLVYAEKLKAERNIRGGDADERDEESIRAVNEEVLSRFTAIEQEFFQAVARQEKLARTLSVITPSIAFDSIVTAFAGSSIDEEHEVLRQMRRHFRQLAEYDGFERSLMERHEPDKLPQFTYKPLSISEISALNDIQWFLLILQAGIFLLLGFFFFMRADLRG